MPTVSWITKCSSSYAEGFVPVRDAIERWLEEMGHGNQDLGRNKETLVLCSLSFSESGVALLSQALSALIFYLTSELGTMEPGRHELESLKP